MKLFLKPDLRCIYFIGLLLDNFSATIVYILMIMTVIQFENVTVPYVRISEMSSENKLNNFRSR
jgi:hypothetical protein